MSPRCMRCVLIFGSLVSSLASGVLAAAEPAAPNPATAKEKDADETPANDGLPLKEIEKAYGGAKPPEAVRMLLAISRGSKMGPGEGWFGPAASRYTWEWMARRYGLADGDAVAADKFDGPAHWFARLDRNKDGRVDAEDLDWSDRNPWVQQAYLVNRIFRRIEANGDGKLTRDEWIDFFDKSGAGKDHLVSEDLRDAVLSGTSASFLPGDAPTPAVLIRGLFAGEVGSLNEGPAHNDRAPDFSLKTHDGQGPVHLADMIGPKPIVLTFGNFTCGPFRSMYPGVEDVYKRFHEEAVFLSIYVREAHPTDGWKMESNARAGVAVAQPRTFIERTAVATECHKLLKPSMPLLVDEINDPVGNAYSGMPARLYVIDRQGKVAYKSGRGPFGFKTGEMEQALVMTLLDQASPAAGVDPNAAP